MCNARTCGGDPPLPFDLDDLAARAELHSVVDGILRERDCVLVGCDGACIGGEQGGDVFLVHARL